MFVLLLATKEIGFFFSSVGISFSSVLNNFSIRKVLGSFRGGKVHELDLVPRRIRRAKRREGGRGAFYELMRVLTWEWRRSPSDDVLLCWKFISIVGLRKKFVSLVCEGLAQESV